MKLNNSGMYSHPSFELLRQKMGIGMYSYTERVGMGGYFYLSTGGAMPYNRASASESTERVHDIYDVLRAVEEKRVTKLEPNCGKKLPVVWGYVTTRTPFGLMIVHDEIKLAEMANIYIDGGGFELGARLEPAEPSRGMRHGSKITAFGIGPRPATKAVNA